MKRFLLMLTFLACIIYTHGQIVIEFTKEKNRSKMLAKVQVNGAFPGGDTSWQSYLEKNINASELIGKRARKGKYTVVVILSKDGSISEITCENDPGYRMCEESLRVIQKSRKWRPGKVINRQIVKDTIGNQ
jgi:periplasmic protein TonB